MSLATKGDGILSTHVTWDDVENAMEESTGQRCRFGTNRCITDIGAGNGLLSKIAFVTVDYMDPQPVLPKKFVIKILSLLPQVEIDASIVDNHQIHKHFMEGHNREVHTYNLLWKYKSKKLPIPKIYASKMFTEENTSKGFIVMEYIENSIVKPAVENIKLEDLEYALEAIAEIVAISDKLTPEDRSLFPEDLLASLAIDFYTAEMLACQLKDISRYLDGYSGLIESLATELNFLMSPEVLKTIGTAHDTLGIKAVLSHGDLWSPNLLWIKRKENYCLGAIIDFQIAHVGNAAIDFATVVCSTLSPQERREQYHVLLEKYYNMISSKMNYPFTLTQLEQASDWIFSLCAYNAMSSMVSVAPTLELSKYNSSKEQCVEKCVALIEDIIVAVKKLRIMMEQLEM